VADTRRLPGPKLTEWDWQLHAACRGMASTVFFHPPDERGVAREIRIGQAKQVCRTCPVMQQCLSHALKIPEPYGIWGGISEDERAQRLGVQSLRYPARAAAATSVSPGGQ
jgi:WhiB family redox-sensing transcriptional regulator